MEMTVQVGQLRDYMLSDDVGEPDELLRDLTDQYAAGIVRTNESAYRDALLDWMSPRFVTVVGFDEINLINPTHHRDGTALRYSVDGAELVGVEIFAIIGA
jgi:hypothetical protein